jgi:hypothetical protein
MTSRENGKLLAFLLVKKPNEPQATGQLADNRFSTLINLRTL